jgi:hypothetical protein
MVDVIPGMLAANPPAAPVISFDQSVDGPDGDFTCRAGAGIDIGAGATYLGVGTGAGPVKIDVIASTIEAGACDGAGDGAGDGVGATKYPEGPSGVGATKYPEGAGSGVGATNADAIVSRMDGCGLIVYVVGESSERISGA